MYVSINGHAVVQRIRQKERQFLTYV